MKKTRSLIKYLSLYSFLIIIITGVIISSVWISLEYRDYRLDLENERESLIESRKVQVKTIVEDAVSFIRSEREKSETDLKLLLNDRVNEAVAIAANIYSVNRGRIPDSEIEKIIIEALRPVRFNNGRGYYFIGRFDGTDLLYPIAPQFEGQNLLRLQDSKGTFVMQKELEVIHHSGKGFVRDFWVKPGGSDASEKLTFIKAFPPLQFYIGTGEYLEDFEKDLQERIASTLTTIRVDSDEYLFGSTWDGYTVIGPSKGKNNWDIQDSDGKYVVRELVKQAKEGSGYVSYRIPKGIDKPIIKKISYVAGFPDWEWYIGAGFNETEIVNWVALRRAEIGRHFTIRIVLIGTLFLALFLINFFLLTIFARKLRYNYNQFEYFFTGTGKRPDFIDKDDLSFQEFKALADAANAMMHQNRKSKEEIKERLTEKETLLREIHHRVKNNLQIVSSLLNLQMGEIKGEAQQLLFRESADRIRVMALIHEHLYENENLSSILLSSFFSHLLQDIVSAYNKGPGMPVLSISIADLTLDIDKSIPLGLIVNELVTNSLKYSEREGRDLELHFTLADYEDFYEVIIKDNGTGLDHNTDLTKLQGLGLQLVFSLSEQLNADISWRSEQGLYQGLEWTIRIPKV